MDWMASLQGLVGGVLIGLSAVWLMGALGRIAGISGIIGNLITQRPKGDSAWRLAFVAVDLAEAKQKIDDAGRRRARMLAARGIFLHEAQWSTSGPDLW